MGHLDHDHTHDHTHSHDHDHLHSHEPLQAKDGAVDEQTVAVLRYMLDHNIHHASELSDQANGYLSAALELLEKKDQD